MIKKVGELAVLKKVKITSIYAMGKWTCVLGRFFWGHLLFRKSQFNQNEKHFQRHLGLFSKQKQSAPFLVIYFESRNSIKRKGLSTMISALVTGSDEMHVPSPHLADSNIIFHTHLQVKTCKCFK